ncbi:MAG TPA: signal peptidase I [Pyrinomonadaceae bacterium]|nr:signal peptidase I [Pyrinomonadaceae bacterium]
MSREQRGAGLAEPPAEEDEAPRPARVAGREAGAARGETGRETHGPGRGVLREYFESLVVTAVMALFGMTFVVQAVKVPTGSMQNTILIGDHLLVNKFIFAPGPSLPFLPQREIRRGDIIVFKYPGRYMAEERFRDNPEVDDTLPNNIPYKTNYVKRVIGLPGERVEVRGTDVYVNGQPLPEQKVAAVNPPDKDDDDTSGDERGAPLKDEAGEALIGDHAPARTADNPYLVYWSPQRLGRGARFMGDDGEVFDVPEGYYLVLGDNRENSLDSRAWGYVPRSTIIGRAMFVYWSYDESLPASGNFLVDFFKNSRWGRTFTLVK